MHLNDTQSISSNNKRNFFARIKEKTEIRMYELQKTDESGIYFVMEGVEEQIKWWLDRTESNSKLKQQKHDGEQKKVKWCSHQRTITHDTECCHFKQKKQKSISLTPKKKQNKKKNYMSKNIIIDEGKLTPCFSAKCKNFQAPIILNISAHLNFISSML